MNNNPSSLSQVSWSKALSTVFKLNYLTPFHTWDDDEELLSLCQTCSDLLSNLHQLYNDFVELGKINSYVSQKLNRLNEIMDYHQQGKINCDLINNIKFGVQDCCSPVSLADDDDDASFSISSTTYNQDTEHSSTISNNSNNDSRRQLPTTTTTIIFDREPRIILTRLPQNYSKLPSGSTFAFKPTIAAADKNSDRTNDDDYEDEDQDVDEGVPVESEEEDLQESSEINDTMDSPPSSPKSEQKAEKTTVRVSIRTRSSLYRRNKLKDLRATTTKSKSKGTYTKSSRNKYSESTSSSKQGKTKSKNVDVTNSIKLKTGRTFICEIRGAEITPTRNLDRRYIVKRLNYPNPCWYCKRTDFPSPTDCLEHTKKKHLPINHKEEFLEVCEQCAIICFTEESWNSHKTKCALIPSGVCMAKTIPCTKCPKFFGSNEMLKAHMDTTHVERRFACDERSYHKKLASALKVHKNNMHGLETSGSRVKCEECGKFLKNKIVLLAHTNSQHTIEGRKKYEQQRKHNEALKAEKRKRRAAGLSTVCADCQIDFYSRLAFRNHRRSAHGEIECVCVCEKCERDFQSVYDLKKHQVAHTDNRPFLCQEYGKGYKTATHLNSHYRATHTVEGRQKYNEMSTAKHRRRKLLAKQLAERQLQLQTINPK